MEKTMEHLKAAMRRLAPPKDRSYRDPYRLVINLAATRKPYGVLGLFFLAVSVSALAAGELFLPARGLSQLAWGFGVFAGILSGWWRVGALCQESLSSIRPMPQSDHDQLQSSQTRGASPAASEVEVRDQEPIAVAPNSTRSATVEPVGVTSA